jgi:hypothetical protein
MATVPARSYNAIHCSVRQILMQAGWTLSFFKEDCAYSAEVLRWLQKRSGLSLFKLCDDSYFGSMW